MAQNNLYQLLSQHFDKSELRQLCFELHIDYEELSEQRKADFVRELILYCQRHKRLPDLLQACRRFRPEVTWPDKAENIALGLPSVAFWQRPFVIAALIVIGLLTLITTTIVNIGGEGLIGVLATEMPTATAAATPTTKPTTTPLPIATPLPFAPEQTGEILIVIASFARSEGVADAEAHNEIKRAIEKAADDLEYSNLRVEVVTEVLQSEDREGAEALGAQYDASIVIWGDETAVRVTVNYFNRKAADSLASDVEVSVARPDNYVQFITADLPGQLTFLSLFTVAKSYIAEVNIQMTIQALEEAVSALEDVGNPPEGAEEAYFLLGIFYQVTKDYQRAIAAYDQVVALNPNLIEAYLNRGIIQKNQGDLTEAIADYDQAIMLDPERIVAYIGRGQARANQGDLEGAIADYDQAIALDPEMAEAYANRGNAHLDQGDLEEAMADYDQAIALNSDLPEVYYNRGNTQAAQGNMVEAITDYDQAITLNPGMVEAYANRGKTLSYLGYDWLAINNYNQAMALNPDIAMVYVNRGISRVKVGNLEEAIEDFDQALVLEPGLADAYAGRGMAYQVMGNSERALADLRYFLTIADESELRTTVESIIVEIEAALTNE